MKALWSDKIFMGKIQFKNRICMAALTRMRCNPNDGIPNQLLRQYYTQRAGMGLILSQATAWSQSGQAFPGAACLYNKEHVEGWKKVVESVQKAGSKIFLQIFHAGRATHFEVNRGIKVKAPSAIRLRGKMRLCNNKDYETPEELNLDQIKQYKAEFEYSVKLSLQCGFDGIQLHGAHGYLIDSFLRSQSNQRHDHYGGNAQNRCRFALQLVDIALKYYEPWMIGMKISPVSRINDMLDKNPEETFGYLLKELSTRKIGFVEIRESTEDFPPVVNLYGMTCKDQMQNVCKTLKPYFNGIVIANDSFNPETGIAKIQSGDADMVSFGRLSVSNPDLAQRILNCKPVNKNWDFSTFYGSHHGSKGYTDYQKFSANFQQPKM